MNITQSMAEIPGWFTEKVYPYLSKRVHVFKRTKRSLWKLGMDHKSLYDDDCMNVYIPGTYRTHKNHVDGNAFELSERVSEECVDERTSWEFLTQKDMNVNIIMIELMISAK